MANRYKELKDKQQETFNQFPMFFAFNPKQFEEGMKKLGLEPSDTDKIAKITSFGGYIRKTDIEAYNEMCEKADKEKAEAIAADLTGDGYIYDMFNYELSNHEFVVTGSLTDTLFALGLTPEKINADARLMHGLRKAVDHQRTWYDEN